jgi:hypothetical protein
MAINKLLANRAWKRLYRNLKGLLLVDIQVSLTHLRIVSELRLGGLERVLIYILEVHSGVKVGCCVAQILVVLSTWDKKRFVMLVNNTSVDKRIPATSRLNNLVSNNVWIIMDRVQRHWKSHLEATEFNSIRVTLGREWYLVLMKMALMTLLFVELIN